MTRPVMTIREMIEKADRLLLDSVAPENIMKARAWIERAQLAHDLAGGTASEEATRIYKRLNALDTGGAAILPCRGVTVERDGCGFLVEVVMGSGVLYPRDDRTPRPYGPDAGRSWGGARALQPWLQAGWTVRVLFPGLMPRERCATGTHDCRDAGEATPYCQLCGEVMFP